MKPTRRWNWPLWLGLLLSPMAFLSYPFLFEQWPLTRDFPWANLLLFGLSGTLLVIGAIRAFAPGRLRALRIAAAMVVGAVGAVVFATFLRTVFIDARHLPASAGAPQVGARVPDFVLPDENGHPVALADLLASPASTAAAPRGTLLIFSMYAGCRACNSEYREIQQRLDALQAAGVRPVVISIETPSVSKALSQEAGYTFTFLSDPQQEVIRRYDVADGDAARPAEFLIDRHGIVRWRNLTASMFVRVRPAQILAAATLLP